MVQEQPLEELLSGTAAVFSSGISRLRGLETFLGAERVVHRPSFARVSEIDYVVGWGHRPTTRRARRFAERANLPFVRLEDGFLRSCHTGRRQPPASLVIDPYGIYYDARTPSRLELLVAQGITDSQLLQRASRVAERIVASKLSKYNYSPREPAAVLSRLPERYVLVVDQLSRDTSVRVGAGANVFAEMIEAARRENPDLPVVVKTHPAARRSHPGALESAARGRGFAAGCVLVSEPINPHTLIERADKVHVGTSQLGFEALLHGKPVVCFGTPFYAGWGLTDDRATVPRRGVPRSLTELVAAALLLYPRYVHPITGRRCDVEDVLSHFELQNRQFDANRGRVYCFGFWWWKRANTRPFLQSPEGDVRYCWSAARAERDGFDGNARALSWGYKDSPAVRQLCRAHGVSLERMEDGFIRSVGLGSDLTAPWSLVVDRNGMYFDPSTPSDLESLLSNHRFTDEELNRAQRLREWLVGSGLSKYNPQAVGELPKPWSSSNRRRILVPGQVENDASVRLGCPGVKTNLELLRGVRERNPDAFVLFKPHPDVLAGNRPGAVDPALAERYCDAVVTEVPISQCLDDADEVHTMTSLVGFEALLRGLRVVTYGQPFYAGWGLTADERPVARRTRRLSIDQLVAAALLLYPRYVDPQTGYFCTAEQAIERLVTERDVSRNTSDWTRLPGARPLRRAANFVQGMIREAQCV